jgi:hypothetical protein
MGNFLRRLRGAVGIAVTWGALWAAIGVVLTLAIGVLRPEEIDPGEGPGKVAAVLGLVGFLSGLGFAGLLYVGEKRRTIRELSLGRVALWGALGAAAIPALMGAPVGEGWITGILGGVFAVASVAVARRAALRGRKQPALLKD